MKIGFDIISDLNLSPEDSFNWEGKATSLYCLVAGSISSDMRTIALALTNLSHHYQGVFYIPGSLEYQDTENLEQKTNELLRACKRIRNVAVLHHHVVIIDGIAVLGSNGWYGNTFPADIVTEAQIESHRYEDLIYLKNSIEKLQRHLDVTKIVIVSNSVPNPNLYFGEVPDFVVDKIPPNMILSVDTQKKVSHWVFGTHNKIVDTVIDNINYVNNPGLGRNPYWAKRIEVEI